MKLARDLVIVLAIGLILYAALIFSLPKIFPGSVDEATFSAAITLPSVAGALITMVSLAIYLDRRRHK